MTSCQFVSMSCKKQFADRGDFLNTTVHTEITHYPPAPRGADAISLFSEMGYAAANTRKYTDMFRAGEIDPSAPGQAFCLEAYKESEMLYLSLINRLDQK